MERRVRREPRTSIEINRVSVAARAAGTFGVATVLVLLSVAGVLPASLSIASGASTQGTLKATAIPSSSYQWYALNDSNQIAGIAYGNANAGTSAVRWNNGVAITLSGDGGAFAIDDAGSLFGAVVMGAAHDGFPAIWSPTGALTKLTAAQGLADSLNITVRSASTNGNVLGITSKTTGPTTLPVAFYALAPGYHVSILPSDIGVEAEAINNSGAIAVGSYTAPYVWSNGAKRALKVDPTSHLDFNNNGDVAGYLVPFPASGNPLPALELANGTVVNLPTLSPGDEVLVRAINDQDEVVGVDENHSTGVSTAVAWINGREIPVASLVAGSFSSPLSDALDVNNNGSILAQSGSTYYLLGASGGPSVTGTISYDYAEGSNYASGTGSSGASQVTPSRDTEVDILASSKTKCSTTVLATVHTTDAGAYNSGPISTSQKYFCVKIVAATPYSEVIPYSSEAESDARNGTFATDTSDAYATDPLGPEKLSTSGATTFSWKPTGVDDPIDQALDVNNAVVTGASWLTAYGDTPKFIHILYPYPEAKFVSNFSYKNNVGEINKDDAFDWGVLLHEYGHYVASEIGIDNTVRVKTSSHDFPYNMTDLEANKSQGVAISWNEGFADFFSQMVQRAMGTSALGLTDVGANPPTYIDHLANGRIVSLDLQAPSDAIKTTSLGEDSEASIARVLWSIYNTPTFSGVGGSVSFVKTLAGAMTTNDNRDLSGAVSALLASLKASPWVPDVGRSSTNAELPVHYNEELSANTYGSILSTQSVAPTLVKWRVLGSTIFVGWKAGQPSGARDNLNLFLVQFWNSSWSTLLTEQVVDSPPVPEVLQDGSDVFTASQAIAKSWGQSAVNIVVLGWNTDAPPSGLTLSTPATDQLKLRGQTPLTGPYIGNTQSVRVGAS
jgi:hypothetical protein